MPPKPNRARRAAGYIKQYLADVADSARRAHEAREIMSQSDSFFERNGTTRESTIRRIFEI